MRTSGSSILNPRTTAAALFARLRALTTRMTGAPSILAISAVLPVSPVAVSPSYRPRTPSTTAMSASAVDHPNRLFNASGSSMNESRFRDGRPVAAVWNIGSMKSGPTLNPCTFFRLDSRLIRPVATVVFPTPLPAPARTMRGTIIASPLTSP